MNHFDRNSLLVKDVLEQVVTDPAEAVWAGNDQLVETSLMCFVQEPAEPFPLVVDRATDVFDNLGFGIELLEGFCLLFELFFLV